MGAWGGMGDGVGGVRCSGFEWGTTCLGVVQRVWVGRRRGLVGWSEFGKCGGMVWCCDLCGDSRPEEEGDAMLSKVVEPQLPLLLV